MAKFAEFSTRRGCSPQTVLKTFLGFALLLLYINNVSLYIKISCFVTNQHWILKGWVKLYSKYGLFHPSLNETASLLRQGNVVTAHGTAQESEQETTKVVSNRKCSACLKRKTASTLGVILLPTSQLGQQLRREERRKDETQHAMNLLTVTLITTSKRKQVKGGRGRKDSVQYPIPGTLRW